MIAVIVSTGAINLTRKRPLFSCKVHAYEARYRTWMIEHMVRLLAQKRFRHVDFALVRYHVPVLADLTKSQLLEAVEKNKDSVAAGRIPAT